MLDIIRKKRDGGALSAEEIQYFVNGITHNTIPLEQASALLMAIYFNGMNRAETLALTLAMAHSGDMADLSGIPGITADKHSTGGVGDKTTLIVGPIVAACGVTVAKMSGRGLGHTGGTVDKLMSIPGFRTELPQAEFIRVASEIGLCLAGQSANLAPADKKLYALRDITGTVESLPLIAASIMSKKLAAGADCILLDVKYGTGAFMQTREAAQQLADTMLAIGKGAGKETAAVLSDMNRPLGRAIGNALEVKESVELLQGRIAEGDLYEICLDLSAHMLNQAGKGSLTACRSMAEEALRCGAAYRKFKAMVKAQGGDETALDDLSKLPQAAYCKALTATADGVIEAMNTQSWGLAAMKLGAGRAALTDTIDYGAGIFLYKKPGDAVKAGEVLAAFYADDSSKFPQAMQIAREGLRLAAGFA